MCTQNVQFLIGLFFPVSCYLFRISTAKVVRHFIGPKKKLEEESIEQKSIGSVNRNKIVDAEPIEREREVN
jgi:hypothetical protein